MQAYFAEQGRLRRRDQPRPTAAAGEVVVEVAYAGLNRADLLQIAGHYPPPAGASDVLGLEVSGTVVAIGSGVEQLQCGDEICALLAGGGWADYVAVPAGQVVKVPAGVDLAAAAGICEVFATAWFNIYMLAAAQPGERLLIHAGASGVGSAAIQLTRKFGNPVFVTVGSDSKLDWCKALGAEDGWNRTHGDFVAAVKAWGKADVILNPVGGDYLGWDQQVLNQDGRIIVIGLMGGRDAQIDVGRLLVQRQSIRGSTLRSQNVAQKTAIMQQLQQYLWPLFSRGELQVSIDTIYPLTELATALTRLRENETQGKLIVDVGGGGRIRTCEG